MGALLDAAQTYVQAHISVIPIADTKTKRPSVRWGMYQEHCPPPAELARWWGSNPALAIVCGAVSGGLTVLDFDAEHRLIYDEWREVLETTHPGLVDSLPLASTQRGGRHLYVLSLSIEGNQKLATTPMLQVVDAATGEIRHRVFPYIETRGQGGYVLAPPTPGYTLLRGDLAAIPFVNLDDYQALVTTARMFHEDSVPADDTHWLTAPAETDEEDEEKPGTLYNRKATVGSVVALLANAGWHVAHTTSAGVPFLTRPGKSTREGVSGNVKIINGIPVFYNFSTSVVEFAVKGYSPFQILGLLTCKGDWAAAAKLAYKLAVPQPIPFTIPASRMQQNPPPESDPPVPNQTTEADDLPLFKLWTDVELIALPPPEMLIKDVLPAKGLSILYAAAGVGKSFLAIDWAYRVALGLDWFGLPSMPGQVLYVAAEGQGGLGKRLQVWHKTYNQSGRAAAIRFITHPIYPTRAETCDTLLASVEHAVIEKPVLIVIDTLARVNEGDENSTKDMSTLINAIDVIRVRFDCAVLLIHHRGHTEGRIRGSSTLLGAADAVLTLEKDADTGVLTLKADKMKDAVEFDPWKIMLTPIPIDDAREVTSCVVSLASGTPRKLTEPMRAILGAIAAAGLEGLTFSEIHMRTTLAKSTLNRVLQELTYHHFLSSEICSKKYGTKYQITTLGGTKLSPGCST